VRNINNSRRAKQSQPGIGCRPSTWYSTHPFPQMDHSQNGTEAFRSRPTPVLILIANPRLKSRLTPRDFSSLKISNRERMAISCLHSSPERIGPLITRHLPPVTEFLIVTPESKVPATPTKQTPNQNSNRYKTHVSHPESLCGLPPSAPRPSASCIPHAPRLTWRRASHLPARRSFDTCDRIGINLHLC
jgi:hypothetical protein